MHRMDLGSSSCKSKKEAYVTQEDIVLETLTIREAVYYSAELQLPDKMTKEQKKNKADDIIFRMGLQTNQDTYIGGLASKGISGGQKRRLSICLEILTDPKLIFLDEPTSGLDSAASLHVMNSIVRLAHDLGRTVVLSVHQPSSQVFQLFDDVCLLAYGKTVYFGQRDSIEKHFWYNCYPCPPLTNPADHYLQVINKDFEMVNSFENGESGWNFSALWNACCGWSNSERRAQKKAPVAVNNVVEAEEDHGLQENISDAVDKLVNSYKSMLQQDVLEKAVRIRMKNKGYPEKRSQAGFWYQAYVLIRRSSVNMSRDYGYYWLRFFIYLAIAICLGTVFYKLDISYSTIHDRSAVLQFLAGFLTFMTIGGFPSFVEDVKIFERERLNGHYGVLVYVIAHTISSIPFLIFVTVVPGVFTYYMVGLQSSVSHFMYFITVLCLLMTIVESLMMMIASIIPNFLYGIILGAGIQGTMMITSGFFRLPRDIPNPVWKYPFHYIAFHTYGGQGFFKNEFFGLTFPNKEGNYPPFLTGIQIVRDIYQMEVSYSKWVDLGVLVAMIFIYRLSFFAIHKLKERVVPKMRSISRQALKKLLRRHSSVSKAC